MWCHLLISSLSEIDKQAAEHGNPDLVYDVQVTIDDVVVYTKHQIHNAQQKQTKAMAINLLDEESAFWLDLLIAKRYFHPSSAKVKRNTLAKRE